MSLEQQLWLERRGLKDIWQYEYIRQSATRVYVWSVITNRVRAIKKDLRNWHF